MSLLTTPHIVFETESLAEPPVINSARMAGYQGFLHLPSDVLTCVHGCAPCLAVLRGCWGLNMDPYVCMVNIFCTESSPYPRAHLI